MAGDLINYQFASLARGFEYNASRIRSILDDIVTKYDRPFPGDDVIDLSGNIVRDNGRVKFMRTRKIGSVPHKTYHGIKEDIPTPLESLLESRLETRSPESEKSFISANCSRYVTDIGEESEPSDAETITSSSDGGSDDEDSNSWEDERTEVARLVAEEESDADRCPSENGSERVSEHSPEEDGNWLSINRQQYHSRQQRRGHHKEKRHKHGHGQTKTNHQSKYRSTKRRSTYSTEPSRVRHSAHSSHKSCSRHEMFLHNTNHESHGWRSAKGRLQTSPTSTSPLKDRIGPPRRVVPVRLFHREEESEVQSSPNRSTIVITTDTSDDSSQEKGLWRKMSTSSSPFSDAADEVDFCLPAEETILSVIQPLNSNNQNAKASLESDFSQRFISHPPTGSVGVENQRHFL